MKLFESYEAVKFHEENLILITRDSYLYYSYNPEYKRWKKHANAGNYAITVQNYDDVRKEELIDAMQGIFPKKETDFMRLCFPEELCIRDMMDLLKEDYSSYMSDYEISHAVHRFLLNSMVCYKSFLETKKLFDNAISCHQKKEDVYIQIIDLSLSVIGRDIFKEEIGIVDGHCCSSYFWIMPVRVIDYSNTDETDNVAEMRSIEISIEEEDVSTYLSPFLYKHYDDELEANKNRIEYCWIDDNGNEQTSAIKGFKWYLTRNFFDYDSMAKILSDITDTIEVLSSGKENEFTTKLKDASHELIIDFYRRFIYRMEYMIKVGKENGYDLISFMGP